MVVSRKIVQVIANSNGFQFGESQRMRLVRVLRATVMVRVGGGWQALEEFLVKNDPCRGKQTFLYSYGKISERV